MSNQAIVPGGESVFGSLTKLAPSAVVPAGEIWLLTHARARYTADATVATRYFRGRVRDTAAADPQCSITLFGSAPTASQDKMYQFGVGKPGLDIEDATIPGGQWLVCVAGQSIELVADAGAPAGDTFSGKYHVWKIRVAR